MAAPDTMTIGHILSALTNKPATGANIPVASVVIDSRQVQAGSLFIAFRGERVDGHDFVRDAFANGAIAAIVERPIPGDHLTIDTRTDTLPETITPPICLIVEDSLTALQTLAKAWRAQFPHVRVVGITGSVGKTSTKELVYSVLAYKYNTLKSEGNQNNEIGLPLTLLKLRPHHQYAVLEMGMYARGEIALLCDIARPHIGVVTLIGPVHLERLKTMEAIVAAKQELVEALPADGIAILNRDDERVMNMATATKARVFTYGLSDMADLWADNIRSMGLQGVRFTLHYGKESLSVQVPLLGRHSVHTALRATAVGLATGLSWEEIVAGLRHHVAQLRLVSVPGPNNSIIIDDTYNASPDSVMAALNLLQDLPGRRIAVLGDMLELGQVEESAHRLVGRRVADIAHILITVGPRSRLIYEEALAVGMSPDRAHWVEDAPEAVPLLEEMIQPEDIILIKGSWGMRMDRIVTALGRG